MSKRIPDITPRLSWEMPYFIRANGGENRGAGNETFVFFLGAGPYTCMTLSHQAHSYIAPLNFPSMVVMLA